MSFHICSKGPCAETAIDGSLFCRAHYFLHSTPADYKRVGNEFNPPTAVDGYPVHKPKRGQAISLKSRQGHNTQVAVEQLDEKGNVLGRWPSLKACAKELGLNWGSFRGCLARNNVFKKKIFRKADAK